MAVTSPQIDIRSPHWCQITYGPVTAWVLGCHPRVSDAIYGSGMPYMVPSPVTWLPAYQGSMWGRSGINNNLRRNPHVIPVQ